MHLPNTTLASCIRMAMMAWLRASRKQPSGSEWRESKDSPWPSPLAVPLFYMVLIKQAHVPLGQWAVALLSARLAAAPRRRSALWVRLAPCALALSIRDVRRGVLSIEGELEAGLGLVCIALRRYVGLLARCKERWQRGCER